MSDPEERPGEELALPDDLDPALNIDKLSLYALNESSTDGKHKARMFRDMLDFGPDDAEALREQLMDGVHSGTVTGTRESTWGFRYKVEIPVEGNNDKTASVETVWQVEPDSTTLKLITVRSIRKSS